MTKKLQITLYLVAVYFAFFGILFLFAPAIAEQITQTTHDPVLNLLYGQYTLIFAYIAFMAAREKKTSSKLSLTILLVTAGHVIIFGYILMTKMQGFSQVGPPIIVNSILTILLFLFRKERPHFPID